MVDKIFYSNNDMKTDLLDIIRQIEGAKFKPTCILGIARGGVIPATLLSEWYNCPLYTYHLSFRDHTNATSNKDVYEIIKNKNYSPLVVDDICDSGLTLKTIANEMSSYMIYPRFAVLINNLGQNVFEPDFTGREINKSENDTWIDYYYETWWKHE